MRNTLILTQQVADNFEVGMPAFAAVVEAAVQRARPVVLTALAAVLAFVPLTQDSFWGPLAYVLIGGVAAGIAITLLFVPALYAVVPHRCDERCGAVGGWGSAGTTARTPTRSSTSIIRC